MPAHTPQRIVCLTEETCETLYLHGGQDRVDDVNRNLFANQVSGNLRLTKL